MQIHRGFPLHRPSGNRLEGSARCNSIGGSKGVRDTRVQAENEIGKGLEPWPTYQRGSSKLFKVSSICSAVCRVMDIEPIAFKGDRRDKYLVTARHIAYYLCREHTMNSYPDIAYQVNRDHTTVMYGAKKVARRLAHGDADIRLVCDAVLSLLRANQ